MKQLSKFLILVNSIFLSTQFFANADCSLCPKEVLGPRKLLVGDPNSQSSVCGAVDTTRGNYFLAWSSYDLTGQAINARLFNRFGTPITAILNLDRGSFNPFPVQAAYNATSDVFLIVWQNTLRDSNRNLIQDEIKGQLFSSDGTPLSSIITYLTAQSLSLGVSDLLFNSNNNQFLLSYSIRNEIKTRNVLQRLSQAGVKIGSPEVLNQSDGGLDLSFDPISNRYLSVLSKGDSIQFQLLTASLQKGGSARRITTGNVLGPPFVEYDSTNSDFVVFWNATNGLKSQRIASNGNLSGDIVRPGLPGGGSFAVKRVAYNPASGGFVVTYGRIHLFLTRLNSDLVVTEKQVPLSCLIARGHNPGPILFNGLFHEFLVTWVYGDRNPQSSDIYGQRVRAVPTGTCSNQ